MQRTQVLEFARLLDLGPPAPSSTANWINFSCPLAPYKHASKKDRSKGFGVSVADDKHSRYWCFTCHSQGEFHQLAYELGQYRDQNYIHIGKEIQRQEMVGPVYVPRKWDEERTYHEEAALHKTVLPPPEREFEYYSAIGHPYLRQRGIGFTITAKLGLRFDPYQRRVLFPVYNRRGTFAGFSGRRIDPPARFDSDGTPFEPDGSEYLKVRDYSGLRKSEYLLGEHRIFGRSTRLHFPNSGRPVSNTYKKRRNILVEGLFDYAYCSQVVCGAVSTCIMGSWLTPAKVSTLIASEMATVLFLDNDKAGQDCVEQCKDLLFGKIPLLTVEYPDGFEGADPSSLPRDVLLRMYNAARLLT